MFHSIHDGNTIGRAVAVGGFLVMRVGMIFLWCVPPGRIIPASGLPGYAVTTGVAQVGWVTLLLAGTTVGVFLLGPWCSR